MFNFELTGTAVEGLQLSYLKIYGAYT